jgi:hypothetical protein
MRAVVELERTRLRPGAIAEALHGWARFVRGPLVALEEYEPELCLEPACQWTRCTWPALCQPPTRRTSATC